MKANVLELSIILVTVDSKQYGLQLLHPTHHHPMNTLHVGSGRTHTECENILVKVLSFTKYLHVLHEYFSWTVYSNINPSPPPSLISRQEMSRKVEEKWKVGGPQNEGSDNLKQRNRSAGIPIKAVPQARVHMYDIATCIPQTHSGRKICNPLDMPYM